MTGAAGPNGTYALALQIWLLQFGTSPSSLREDMPASIDSLSNKSPPWAAYHTIMAARLDALDKLPGVRPEVIREICRRLIYKLQRGAGQGIMRKCEYLCRP